MPGMTGQAAAQTTSGGHLERFDLDEQSGRLIDAEHRGRYWWAAQLAEGRDVLDAACGTGYGSRILEDAGAASVTGIDVSSDAVQATAERLGDRGAATVADIRDLPFEDESFDLVVSFETIEHIAEGEKAIAEFRRVLRSDGILVVSSPNPAVYPEGNEHHVHEYGPDELVELAGHHFSNRAVHAQHTWLASAIASPAGAIDSVGNGGGQEACDTRGVSALAPNGQTYSAVVARNGELPPMRDLVTLGDAFEVRWWEDQLAETKKYLARVVAENEAIADQLRQASNSLLEANQHLAQVPVLKHRLEEAHAERQALMREVEGSLSWRITAPLRRLSALRRRAR